MHASPISLSRIVADIESGASTPARRIAETKERIDAVEPEIRAFAHRASEEALADAERATGSLAGVPLGFKDIFDTADMPTEYGSPIHAGFQPASDATLVAQARSAGAAVMGKTATTEFAFLTPTVTRNPWNTAHTPGGSSSGSAAGVASGMLAGAFGSQTAGSVIRPASFCGVAGYKPSFRLLPTTGMRPMAWTLDTVGLFAKGVGDVALLADLVSGRELRVAENEEVAGLTVGLYRAAADSELEPAMVEALEKARGILEHAGARVIDVDETADLRRAHEVQFSIQLYESALSLAHERRLHADRLSLGLRASLDEGAAITPAEYDTARRFARRGRREVTALFERVDMLLAPSALGAAPGSLETTGSPSPNRLWTLTGNPCVNVPGLLDPAGMPLGLTMVGRFGQDRATLAAAAGLERAIARF